MAMYSRRGTLSNGDTLLVKVTRLAKPASALSQGSLVSSIWCFGLYLWTLILCYYQGKSHQSLDLTIKMRRPLLSVDFASFWGHYIRDSPASADLRLGRFNVDFRTRSSSSGTIENLSELWMECQRSRHHT